MSKPGISRRKFLASVGIGGLAVTSYIGVYEPSALEVKTQKLDLGRAPGATPIKLLHVSDLHASWCVSLGQIAHAIDTGLQLKPDLICVTGDFITSTYSDFDKYVPILARLSAAAPVYACLGNHDGGWWAARRGGYPTSAPVRQLLQKSGIELLHNRWTTLRVHGRDVQLSGLPDGWSEGIAPARAFPEAGAEVAPVRIVLSHNPDSKEYLRAYGWDLLLSGHTHGGQVVLPFIGAPWTPTNDKRFVAGLYSWDNRWLHISKGVGNVRGVRFNCPPDVSLITIS